MKIEVTLSREWKTSELRHVIMALAKVLRRVRLCGGSHQEALPRVKR